MTSGRATSSPATATDRHEIVAPRATIALGARRRRVLTWATTSKTATTCCSSTEAKEPAGKGQHEGAIGVILQEPRCGAVLERVAEKAGAVHSPHEPELRGVKTRFSPRCGELWED